MPKLKKGMRPLQLCITYPDEARTSGIQGQVGVRFVVNRQGLAEHPEIIHGIAEGLTGSLSGVLSNLHLSP
ncbi:energy transducer TonB [Halalkalibaculum sp. DA384]